MVFSADLVNRVQRRLPRVTSLTTSCQATYPKRRISLIPEVFSFSPFLFYLYILVRLLIWCEQSNACPSSYQMGNSHGNKCFYVFPWPFFVCFLAVTITISPSKTPRGSQQNPAPHQFLLQTWTLRAIGSCLLCSVISHVQQLSILAFSYCVVTGHGFCLSLSLSFVHH